MPAMEDMLMLETQSERLGHLWRSQGQTFLDEQAAELNEDIERLRDSYLTALGTAPAPTQPRRRLPSMSMPKPKPKLKVIDLRERRDPEISPEWVCSTRGHFLESATARCTRCRGIFCRQCILQTEATHGRPLCLECALVAAGVHHKRARPLRVR